MFNIGDTTPAPYTVDRQVFSPSVAALVLTADNGDTLVVAEPKVLFRKVNGLYTVQSRRAVNSVTFNPHHWSGYNLKYRK